MIGFRRNIWFVAFLFNITVQAFGQSKVLYGNEWIKYEKSYVRIGVVIKGIQKVNLSDLPAGFDKSKPEKFQLWHRGKEIPLISSSSNEISFYGVPNDGSSDSAVFRPSSARLNPYTSLFSDEASYYLTISDSNGKRVEKRDNSNLINKSSLNYHFAKDIKTFNSQFSFSTFGVDELLNNSFYQEANSPTSAIIWGPNATSQYATGFSKMDVNISMKNYYSASTIAPEIEILVNGLNSGAHNVQVKVGRDTSNTSLSLIGNIPFSGYDGKKAKFILKDNTLFGSNGEAILRVSSSSEDTKDWFGLSYLTLTYPQIADMSGLSSSYFYYRASDEKTERVKISNVPLTSELLDISDPFNPIILKGRRDGTDLEAQIDRQVNKEMVLLVSDPTKSNIIPSSRIYSVNFSPVYAFPEMTDRSSRPKGYNFLMVTTDNLEASSIDYAKYRSSESGGNHRTLLLNIRRIYDEFNYGEPSPVAIRNYVAYMLSEGIRPDKHNLLLFGHSVTWPTRLVKEMPGEVPTLGDPGSDMLLVAGLNGNSIDVPAIPVGRINAFTNEEVRNYLDKVNTYEHETETAWRRNVLHLNGGHSVSEINQLKSLLSDLVPEVENGVIGGQVQAFVKRQGITETEKVNISTEVNSGAGMITYFGHGSQTITDLDMGYVSDATRGYSNSKKYPLMFFNGCGVGNTFASRITHTLSSDWLLTANKGAIAVVSNSYKSYVSTSAKHLRELYKQVFVNKADQSLGQVLIEVSKAILSSNPNLYDIANLHQTYIQGDPSIIAIRSNNPDFSIEAEGGILVYSERQDVTIGNSKNIRIGAVVSNIGRFEKGQTISVRFDYHLSDGKVTRSYEDFVFDSAKDTVYNSFPLVSSLRRIEVLIDPEMVLVESNRNNNAGALDIDWSKARNEFFYKGEVSVDINPPVLRVTYGNRMMENRGSVVKGKNFTFLIDDDRYLPYAPESFELHIASCSDGEGCNFVKVSDDQLTFTQISTNVFEVFYSSMNLSPGDYQILVVSRDKVGNTTNPFKLDFKLVEGESSGVVVNVSPNPASEFVKFRIDAADDLTNWQLLIFDNSGRKINTLNKPQNYRPGDDIYWMPEVTSGLYVYKLIGTTSNGTMMEKSGKIVIVR